MASGSAARRVLIVDNDPRVRHAIHHLIDETPGLRVVAAVSNADEAEAAAQTTTPDLVVIEVRVADRDTGLNLIRNLSSRMLVVAIGVSNSLAPLATRAGATAFCDKDGNTDTFINAVVAALSDGRDGNSAVDQ